LAPIGEKGGLSALLHEGTRAVTVKVNEIVGVAGFALPGNYVDVMVNVSDRDIKPISKIVLKRILVLALAQDTATNETKPKVVNAVTLEVTPEQAEIIDLARSVGSLSLVLRSQIDKLDVNTKGSRMEDLYLSTVAPTSQTSPTSPKSTSISKKTASVALQSNSKNVEKSEVIRGVTKSME
jgi:pilus assembly protein CpaB